MLRYLKLQKFAVPKCCQQRRSARVKRRMQYADFFWASVHSEARQQGRKYSCSSCKDGQSGSIATNVGQVKSTPFSGHKRRRKDEFQDRIRILKDGENKAYILKRLEQRSTELESVTQSTVSDSTENREGGVMECEIFGAYNGSEMATSGSGSGITDSCSFEGKKNDAGCLAPGKLVWAKTANRSWWPAQITEEILISENCGTNHKVGAVLVCFYGSHNYAWVDSSVDLSDFEKSFEENRCNSSKGFQEALEEALIRKASMNHNALSDRRSKDSVTLSQLNQCADMSELKVCSSNKEKDDETEQRRGKRKRKPKVHFDEEVALSFKSLRRVRRLRIMRHLGLVAPPGSPFSVNAPVRTAA